MKRRKKLLLLEEDIRYAQELSSKPRFSDYLVNLYRDPYIALYDSSNTEYEVALINKSFEKYEGKNWIEEISLTNPEMEVILI